MTWCMNKIDNFPFSIHLVIQFLTQLKLLTAYSTDFLFTDSVESTNFSNRFENLIALFCPSVSDNLAPNWNSNLYD